MNAPFRIHPQAGFNFDGLVIDNFAGGGGASTGIEFAIGRPVDIAINHDPEAIRMHEINHPHTKHYCESVWDIDPREITKGLPVDLVWFSPDCKHFSKARGGTPADKNIRGLAWVAMRYAATVKPKIIMLENVEEFLTWGPVVNGKPCPDNKGKTFRSFIHQLKGHGYQVEWKTIIASDLGAPTIRKRFYLVARRDGLAIQWPAATHGNPKLPATKALGLQNWKTAAEIIDWSQPCFSIFLNKEEGKAAGVKRPLADNTLRRIARGIQRFVIENPEPFIVRIGQTGFGGDRLQYGIDKPLTTITSKAEHLLVAPTIERQFSSSAGNSVDTPLGTVTAGGGGKAALCAAFLAKHYGGNYTGPGIALDEPASTVTTIDHHALVTSNLVKLRGSCQHGQEVTRPMPTVTAGGNHVGEVRAFLLKYYGTNIGLDVNTPLHTVPTKDRFGLITVHGEDYQIVDICMRMLQPHELFQAQSFPSNYVIDRDHNGKSISKKSQVARCGNSVCPVVAEALVKANILGKQNEVIAA